MKNSHDEGGADVDLGGLCRTLSHCLGVLSRRGITLHPQSRYAVGLDLLRRVAAAPSQTSTDDWILPSELVCELQELAVVVSRAGLVSTKRRLVQEAPQGNPEPWSDHPTRPRDIQLELYTAAILELGRLPVDFEEPDFHLRYRGQEYGVAARESGASLVWMTEFMMEFPKSADRVFLVSARDQFDDA